MKIVEISSAYPPSRGGVEKAVSELSNRLAERGHEVTVVTSSRGGKSRASDTFMGKVRVIRMPERLHLFEAPLIPQIAIRAFFLDFDVLHVHGMSPTITDLGILVGKLRRKPVVVTYHNDAESTLEWGIAKYAATGYAILARSILGLADSIVCATRSYAQTSSVLKHFAGKFEVISLGVDASRFGKMEPKPSHSMKKKVLFVGQLKDYKGVGFLIDAIAKVRRRGQDVVLMVAGDGPSYTKLRLQAESLGLGEAVRFLGNVDEATLVNLYDSCDMVVLPSVSRREAFGLVQLEATAAGKAVVASDIPGVSDVTKAVGGYLAKPQDADSLALQIENVLLSAHDPKKARETAATMNWERVTTEYEELFETLVKSVGLPTELPIDPPLVAEKAEVKAPLTETVSETASSAEAPTQSAPQNGIDTVL
jgi:glycosyltransferase involved in cell wall biosynthesis